MLGLLLGLASLTECSVQNIYQSSISGEDDKVVNLKRQLIIPCRILPYRTQNPYFIMIIGYYTPEFLSSSLEKNLSQKVAELEWISQSFICLFLKPTNERLCTEKTKRLVYFFKLCPFLWRSRVNIPEKGVRPFLFYRPTRWFCKIQIKDLSRWCSLNNLLQSNCFV